MLLAKREIQKSQASLQQEATDHQATKTSLQQETTAHRATTASLQHISAELQKTKGEWQTSSVGD